MDKNQMTVDKESNEFSSMNQGNSLVKVQEDSDLGLLQKRTSGCSEDRSELRGSTSLTKEEHDHTSGITEAIRKEPRKPRIMWTVKEQIQIFEEFLKHGKCWRKIARAMNSRGTHAVRGFFYCTIRRLKAPNMYPLLQSVLEATRKNQKRVQVPRETALRNKLNELGKCILDFIEFRTEENELCNHAYNTILQIIEFPEIKKQGNPFKPPTMQSLPANMQNLPIENLVEEEESKESSEGPPFNKSYTEFPDEALKKVPIHSEASQEDAEELQGSNQRNDKGKLQKNDSVEKNSSNFEFPDSPGELRTNSTTYNPYNPQTLPWQLSRDIPASEKSCFPGLSFPFDQKLREEEIQASRQGYLREYQGFLGQPFFEDSIEKQFYPKIHEIMPLPARYDAIVNQLIRRAAYLNYVISKTPLMPDAGVQASNELAYLKNYLFYSFKVAIY